MQRLHSRHKLHIRHRDTIFQMSEECFPNQFHHPNKRSATRVALNSKSTKNFAPKPYATSQCSIKWETVSRLQQHIYHQPTKENPLLMSQNPSPCHCPSKEGDLLRSLNTSNTVPIEGDNNGSLRNLMSKTPLPCNC
jgi:hypothetical protein